jgi:hypothetical protein
MASDSGLGSCSSRNNFFSGLFDHFYLYLDHQDYLSIVELLEMIAMLATMAEWSKAVDLS